MPPIQIGIDIATSLSVIGAAIAFTYTQLSQSRKARAAAIRAERVKQMSMICEDLSNIIKEGVEVETRVRQALAGREVDISLDDYTNFCVKIDNYLRVDIACNFNVWANDAELSQLTKFKSAVNNWHSKFEEAVLDRDNGKATSIPLFSDLLTDLITNVKIFSALVREEVERT